MVNKLYMFTRNVYIISITLFFLLFTPGLTFCQYNPFRVTEHLVIGDDEDAPVEYLFADPDHVVTDSVGNIYVADGRLSEIRVFSRSGEHIKTIGRQGKGPGEFTQISAVTIGKHTGRFVVADDTNQRFTIYFSLKKSPKTVPYPTGGLEIGELHSYRNSYLATGFKRSNLSRISNPSLLVHRLSEELSTILQSTARSDTWWNFKEAFAHAQQLSLDISIAPENGKSFLLVPEFYRGTIYRYEERGGHWERSHFNGRNTDTPPYRLHNPQRPRQAPEPRLLSSGPAGRFAASINRQSEGLFVLKNGRMVHFTYEKEHSEGGSIIVEVFHQGGELLRTAPLEGYSRGVTARRTEVLWKDEQDRFYVVDGRGDFPILRVITLDLQSEE